MCTFKAIQSFERTIAQSTSIQLLLEAFDALIDKAAAIGYRGANLQLHALCHLLEQRAPPSHDL